MLSKKSTVPFKGTEEQEKALSEKKRNAEESLKKRCGALDEQFRENGERWRAEILKRITEE